MRMLWSGYWRCYRPLPQSVIKNLHEAVDEMADEKIGYGLSRDMAFL